MHDLYNTSGPITYTYIISPIHPFGDYFGFGIVGKSPLESSLLSLLVFICFALAPYI